jgi:4-carboxymuconolactone decarboxylase
MQAPWERKEDFMKWIFLVVFVVAIGIQSGSVFAQDRMPAMPLEKMTDLQKKYAEEIIKGPRGALYGPFVPLIRSPELMDKAQRMGEYLRYKSAIGTKLSELVILITARQWTQQVEWAIHEPIAIKSGIKADIVRAIADGRYPTGMNQDEEIVYDFCSELHINKSVADATYERALKRFGEQGVIDMLGINGYYTFLAMIMNGTRMAVPDGKPGPLKAFPK